MNARGAAAAEFPPIRYGQCWEDADVLLDALDVGEGDECLSIASAGDNSLALLARRPARVLAIDLNPAQIACLELRVAAYAELGHAEVLELLGHRESDHRRALYSCCRRHLSAAARQYWDARSDCIAAGPATAGRFERYLALFRQRVLPLAHSQARIDRLLSVAGEHDRDDFYDEEWDSWRWRLLFRAFFSRFVMQRLGRDPAFFRHVEGCVADRFLARTRHALTNLDPASNPYLRFILTGRFADALPFALRAENFSAIRDNLDRLEWRCTSLDALLEAPSPPRFDACNLSDVFEYMASEHYERTLRQLRRTMRTGGRVAYWNLLVRRHRPASLAALFRPLADLAATLHARDRAFFYGDFVVEEAT